MPWDLGANLLAGFRTGMELGQVKQANALRQQAATQSQYQMYRQAVKDAETRAGKIIQAALPMLDTTDEASLQRSWASVMPGVFQQLDSQGLTQFEPVALQLRGLHEGVLSGRDTTTMLNAIRRMPGLEPKYLTVARGGRIIEQGTGKVVAEGMPPKAEGPPKGSPAWIEAEEKLADIKANAPMTEKQRQDLAIKREALQVLRDRETTRQTGTTVKQLEEMRRQIRYLWNLNEFSQYDPQISRQVEEATSLAASYLKQGISQDQAVQRANTETRRKYKITTEGPPEFPAASEKPATDMTDAEIMAIITGGGG